MAIAQFTTQADRRRWVPAALAVACFGVLATALIIQAVLDVQPCPLCTYQRIAYGVAGGVAALAFLVHGRPAAWTALVALCGGVLLAGSAIAFYHVGVEHHWWGSAFCGSAGGGPGSLAVTDLRAQLSGPVERPCDIIDWTLFGLSMPTYNVGVLLALGVVALAAVAADRREVRP